MSDSLTDAERVEIAGLIRECWRLGKAYDAERSSEHQETVYDVGERLRGSLRGKPPIAFEGRLYLSRCGELIVVDLATVVDVSGAK